MPEHSWVCPACKSKNPPYTEACRDCGAFAVTPSESNNNCGAPLDAYGSDSHMAEELPVGEKEQCEGSETFFASKKSTLARARIFSLFGLALGAALPILQQGKVPSGILFSVVIVLLIAIPIDAFFRKQLRFGQPLVTLTDEVIEAPNLVGKAKRLRWSDIAPARLPHGRFER